MKNQWIKLICLVILVVFVLSACQPAAIATEMNPTAEKEAPPTDVSVVEPTSGPEQPNPTTQPPPGEKCRVKQSFFPPVKENDWVIGAKDAKTTVLEYSDFMCPYCAQIEPVLARIVQENPNDVRFVYRHFPLISIHDKAALATQAAEAAGLQGKFWEMHKLLFEKQQDWSGLEIEKFKEWLATNATELGLDKAQFSQDLTSDKITKLAQSAFDDSVKLGLPGTPTLAFNGMYYGGDMSYESLSAYIKKMGTVKTYNECPPMTIDAQKKYRATLHLDKGDVKIELFVDKAPVTVNSFVFLAREGWYDGVTFHRVIPDFVAQGGDPFGTGSGGPGYEFINEIAPDLTFGEMGVVGMANSGANTNGSQFFITYDGIPEETVKKLDGNYTIFGKVVEGMDVVKTITPRDPSQNPNLPSGDVIESITIEEQ